MVHILALLLLFIAAPAAAQIGAAAPPPTPNVAGVWNPAAPYITVGQDEPGYQNWYLATPAHAAQVTMFNDYLAGAGVAGVVPTWQLFRTATSWESCGAQPFEVPPTIEWPHIIQTLRYIRDYVVPAVGPVEPVSAYRNPSLNVCAGGAPDSAHKHYSAIDLVPLRPISREVLMHNLCGDHSNHGAAYGAGLGFYAFLRFHIDSTKFRRWNMDPAVAAQCPPLLHLEDAATVGQPLTATAPGSPQPPATTIPPTVTPR
ncbi:MAG: hypothetical protein ABIO80_07500 [Sphingomicrobium sp.]